MASRVGKGKVFCYNRNFMSRIECRDVYRGLVVVLGLIVNSKASWTKYWEKCYR